jgi:hypothetical protein
VYIPGSSFLGISRIEVPCLCRRAAAGVQQSVTWAAQSLPVLRPISAQYQHDQ